MRSIVRISLVLALTALFTLGVISTTPVLANCGGQWPDHCKGAQTPESPEPSVLEAYLVNVRVFFSLPL